MFALPSPPKTHTTEMASADRKEHLLKVANVLAYLLFLVSNIYTVNPPQLTYENINNGETYFTPSIWAFSVWPIIHILLLCPIIYSFASDHGKAVVIDGISWEFPLLTVLYAIFVTVRADHNQTVAFVASFFLAYVGRSIFFVVRRKDTPKSVGEQCFIIFPFSACQAWNAFLLCLTAFEAFGVDATAHEDGFWTRLFVILAL